jgi:hypothetical protein
LSWNAGGIAWIYLPLGEHFQDTLLGFLTAWGLSPVDRRRSGCGKCGHSA